MSCAIELAQLTRYTPPVTQMVTRIESTGEIQL